MSTPDPTIIKGGRQFFDHEGKEVFLAEAYGRRPASEGRDSLRCFGVGPTRLLAETGARETWKMAWSALANQTKENV